MHVTMTCSWILTIHKARILRKMPIEKTFSDFKKWVKSIQTAGYNGAHIVCICIFRHIFLILELCALFENVNFLPNLLFITDAFSSLKARCYKREKLRPIQRTGIFWLFLKSSLKLSKKFPQNCFHNCHQNFTQNCPQNCSKIFSEIFHKTFLIIDLKIVSKIVPKNTENG